MRTINLLPKNRQEELHYEAMLRSLWVICIMSFFSFLIVFAVQFGLKFYLQFQAGSIKSQTAQLQTEVDKQQNSDVKNQVASLNNYIGDYNNLAKMSPKWSKLIKAFSELPPDGIRVNSLTVDPGTKSINITGLSPTRDLVIQLYNNILADDKEFYNINYPLENVAKPTNVNFHFTFFYRPALVQ